MDKNYIPELRSQLWQIGVFCIKQNFLDLFLLDYSLQLDLNFIMLQ